MGLSKKNKRAAKKATRKASTRIERLKGSAQESAQESLSKIQGTVVPAVSEGAKDVRKKTSDLVDTYLPTVQERVQAQGEKVAALTDNISPRAEKLRHDMQEDYLPRARRTAGATNTVVASAVAAAVDAARKELDKGQGEIKKAYSAPTPKQKKGRAGKVLLVLAITAAGAAAGFFAWKKSRPVEDPWAPPADFARAHYPASGATDTDSSEVSDTVGGAEAGDVARSLGNGTGTGHAPSTTRTSDRTGDTAPHDVKFDSASGRGAGATGAAAGSSAAHRDSSAGTHGTTGTHSGTPVSGTHRSDDIPEQGRVIDPVLNPEENPADPDHEGEKRGTHRGDA